MKLSNCKISVQLVVILSTITVLIVALFLCLIWYGQNTMLGSSVSSMNEIKGTIEQTGKDIAGKLQENVGNVNETVTKTVKTLSEDNLNLMARKATVEIRIGVEDALGQARAIGNVVKVYKSKTEVDKLDRQYVLETLAAINKENPNYLGVWVGFEPNAFDGKDAAFAGKSEWGCTDTGRFIPVAGLQDKTIVFEAMEDIDTSSYYTVARDKRHEYVTPPFMYQGTVMISVATPIELDGKFIGVAGIDLNAAVVEQVLNTPDYRPFGNGFAFLVDSTGLVVWHPNKDLVTQSLHDRSKFPGRETLSEGLKKADHVQGTVVDILTGKELYQTLYPLKFGRCPDSWGIVLSAGMEEIMAAQKSTGDLLSELEANSDKQIGNLIDTTNQANETSQQTLNGNARSVIQSTLLVSLVILTVAVIAAIFIGRSFSNPIVRSVAILQGIAGKGDISATVPQEIEHRGDELGDLGRGVQTVINDYRNIADIAEQLAGGNWAVSIVAKSDLDRMNDNLRTMVEKINAALAEIGENVQRVNTGAGEVSSASQTLSSGAQQSAASLEEITASMGEISGQTKKNAASAGEARDLAQKATNAATEGQEAMQEMTGAMDRITKNSNEIQRVIKVIDDIAFQTNLLALNAAVEAARAGVHGKGFAVVAEEVRNLAARSAKAAQETNDLISKSGQEIGNGGAVASRTAEVLNTIVEQVKQTTDLVAGIAVASNEQAQGVAQITVGLQQIDQVTQQNTAAAEESASAANEMSGMASNLQQLVARFKLKV